MKTNITTKVVKTYHLELDETELLLLIASVGISNNSAREKYWERNDKKVTFCNESDVVLYDELLELLD